MRIVSVVLLYTLLIIAGCSGSVASSQTQAVPTSALGGAGTKHLIGLLNAYSELKDALVETNAGKADAAAYKLYSLADSVLQYIGDDTANERTDHLYGVKVRAQKITSMMDEGCEKKRAHFGPMSNHLYDLLKKTGLKNVTIYRQYCAGAFNDKGAYWLSKDKEIRNPYFGKKMLEYGEVVETIQ